MKKILIFITSLLLLSGCFGKKEVDINKGRGDNYTYDFIDLIDISVFGTNGIGFIEVSPKNFTVNDFSTEEEYIAIKKAMEAMKLTYKQGVDAESYIVVTPSVGLKNGDIVNISIKNTYKGDNGGLSINMEGYNFVVSGLEEPTALNLFDESSVMFYGLEGTNEVYPLKKYGGSIPKEILDNLEYTIVTDGTKLEKDKTVLNITADINKDFLNNAENPYYRTDIYLGKNGYYANLQAEKVLTTVVKPLNFAEVPINDIQKSIFENLSKLNIQRNNVSFIVSNIATIQQRKNTGVLDDNFSYLTTFYADGGSERLCLRHEVRIINVNGVIQTINKKASPEVTDNKYCKSAYDDFNLIHNFNSLPTITESVYETQVVDVVNGNVIISYNGNNIEIPSSVPVVGNLITKGNNIKVYYINDVNPTSISKIENIN